MKHEESEMKDWIMVDAVVASEIKGEDKTAPSWMLQTKRTLIRIKDIEFVQEGGENEFYIKVYDDCSLGYWCKGDFNVLCRALTERSKRCVEHKDYGEKEHFAGYREQ